MKRKAQSPKNREHFPVMLGEVLQAFSQVKLPIFYEGTLGAGGHAEAILEKHREIKLYLACDQDPNALEIAKSRLSKWKGKVEFIQGNFSDLDEHLQERGIEQVNGFFLI